MSSDTSKLNNVVIIAFKTMHRSTKFQAPPNAVDFLWSCNKVFLQTESMLYFVLSRSKCHLMI